VLWSQKRRLEGGKMSSILFFIAGFGAIAGAVGVVVLRDPFYSVLALVGHLISLAVLFLLLGAELLSGAGGRGSAGSNLRLGGALAGGALLVELLIALLGTGLKAIGEQGAGYSPGGGGGLHQFGTPAYIGNLLLTRFLLAFEAASFLLLIAAVGGVVLAGRRGGLGEDDGKRELLTPLDLVRPHGTGTTAEGVGGQHR